MKKTIISLFFLISTLFLPYTQVQAQTKKEIVSFSIIFDYYQGSDYFDQLSSWLNSLDYHNFTFVLWEETENSILYNASRVNTLKEYGKIIPRRDYLQQFTPQQRKDAIDSMITKYNTTIGEIPKGLMSFIPDTYTSQYLLERNFTYIQGYCFDQYVIDFMTMRGAFQMPYYANPFHVNMPNTQSRGIVILPHSLWDWIASFKISHNLHTHPHMIKTIFDEDVERAKDYFLKLIDYSLYGSEPFGYCTFQFEWNWIYAWNYTEYIKDWIQELLSRDYTFMDFEEVAQWFRENYQLTPTYRINFISPYTNERIEWYYDTKIRVARIENQVVSFIDYTKQNPDKYLTKTQTIHWDQPQTDLNCIDTRLEFEIDALGGGYLRAPIKTQPYYYTGDLANFQLTYQAPQIGYEFLRTVGILALILICIGFIKWRS
jgi:hypothetical protein